jgi:hypothetical protein
MRLSSIFTLVVLCGTVSACENRKAEARSNSVSPASVTAANSASASATANEVVKIVFVGKEHACDCTRKKLDAATTALHQVLGTSARIPVETLKADTEEEKVEPYRKQRPMMAVPAIYFINSKGSVIEMLQGEITAEQIAHVFKA